MSAFPDIDDRQPYSPVCSFCARLKDNGLGFKCEAFTDRIPDAIWYGQHKHVKTYPGDGGLTFLKIEAQGD